MEAPRTAPMELIIITGKNVNLPSAMRAPVKGIMASFGTGSTVLSRVVKIKSVGYPPFERNEVIKERSVSSICVF